MDLMQLFLVAGRLLPGLLLLPAFGGSRLPTLARLALTLCLAWALLPGLPGMENPPESAFRFWAILLKELGVGLVLAFAAQCAFDALRMAGAWMDSFAGTGRSQLTSAAFAGRAGPLAEMHGLLAIVIFFSLDGPLHCLCALRQSYELLPIGVFPDRAMLRMAGSLALNLSNAAIRCAAALALPAGLAVVLSDGLLGLLNRSAQALPVYFVGMPLRMVAVLAVAGLGLIRLPELWSLVTC